MVAIMNNELFEKSKDFFQNGDISNTIEEFNKVIPSINISEVKEETKYVQFLKQVLKHCRENELMEEEAKVLRSLGRVHSLFNQHFESLNYHRESLKIQRKLGRKADLAEGLILLADSLEINGKYKEANESLQTAASIFHELGKLRREKEVKKQIAHIQKFSKEMVEDEFYVRKFNIRRD